ncbi:cation diffusion facilitator family transporter [Halalkalibacter krulwichiae]|uniref:Zinc transporter ZitB n=1 Tax=Halalkalibacter krulwichiae TaxID=199441 RepID=A0A1Y9THK9_9BACI|nr:cation transporter [Halalkalibacter krulwichiae]ARK28568.1 zinc transporter ZitB [Halalkalibacter krulwichiae]
MTSLDTSYTLQNKLLKLSVYGALLLAIIGIVIGYLVSSQMVLFDGLYSFISVILSFLSLYTANYIRKKDIKRFPFGKEMLEPIVIIIKYLVILLLTFSALVSSFITVFNGGRETVVEFALLYALVSTIVCWAIYACLQKHSKEEYGLIKAEANQWRMDMYLSGAVLIGFLFASLLSLTPYSHIIPYVDPLMVILVASYFVKVPITEMAKAIKEVLEMAPAQAIEEKYQDVVFSIEKTYKVEQSYLRMSKVGSKLYVEIDFILNNQSDILTIDDQDFIREQIDQQTKELKYEKWVTVCFTKNRKWAH